MRQDITVPIKNYNLNVLFMESRKNYFKIEIWGSNLTENGSVLELKATENGIFFFVNGEERQLYNPA